MNNKLLETLESMKGKTFLYASNLHCIIDFNIDDEKERCTVKTNLSSYDRPFEAMDEFLKYWLPVNNLPVLQPGANQNNQLDVFIQQENDLSNKLIDTLNDNIEKVQNNKNYIPQAQAINNNINTIVNIAKMRLDIAKQFRTTLNRKVI